MLLRMTHWLRGDWWSCSLGSPSQTPTAPKCSFLCLAWAASEASCAARWRPGNLCSWVLSQDPSNDNHSALRKSAGTCSTKHQPASSSWDIATRTASQQEKLGKACGCAGDCNLWRSETPPWPLTTRVHSITAVHICQIWYPPVIWPFDIVTDSYPCVDDLPIRHGYIHFLWRKSYHQLIRIVNDSMMIITGYQWWPSGNPKLQWEPHCKNWHFWK